MSGSFQELLTSPWLTFGPLALAIVMFPGGLIFFSLRHIMVGRVSTARVQQVGSSFVLGRFLTEFGLWLFRPAVNLCVKLGVHPDTLSWGSLVISGLAGLLLAQGAFGLGGWLLVFGAMADTMDGAVARARNLSSNSGEVLDASLDRWAEMVVYFGLAWYYRNDPLGFVCALGACAGAVMVSYTRAKGESMGVVAKMGLMQRHERAFWIIMPTLISSMYLAWQSLQGLPADPHPRHWFVMFGLALTMVLGNWTGVVRMNFIRRELGAGK